MRRPVHGMFAFCGLGFQLVEDVMCVVQNALDPVAASDLDAVESVVGMRAAAALVSHWLYSAMTGLALGNILTRHDRSWARRLLVAALLFGVAWGMHSLWDSPPINDQLPQLGGLYALVIKMILTLLVGYVVYRVAMRAEWRHYAATVGAEPDDVVTRTELESMRTPRSRHRARKRHSRHGGTAARRPGAPREGYSAASSSLRTTWRRTPARPAGRGS